MKRLTTLSWWSKPPSVPGGEAERRDAFGHHLGALPKTSPFDTRAEEVPGALLRVSPPDSAGSRGRPDRQVEAAAVDPGGASKLLNTRFRADDTWIRERKTPGRHQLSRRRPGSLGPYRVLFPVGERRQLRANGPRHLQSLLIGLIVREGPQKPAKITLKDLR